MEARTSLVTCISGPVINPIATPRQRSHREPPIPSAGMSSGVTHASASGSMLSFAETAIRTPSPAIHGERRVSPAAVRAVPPSVSSSPSAWSGSAMKLFA